ncbi:hypothetical protein BK748_07905 [Bacillus thuringiensis serovar graciosensis]|nr:hypothetical protein BK748_07905 [Bacillus thuringiensis serovar graciosensis]
MEYSQTTSLLVGIHFLRHSLSSFHSHPIIGRTIHTHQLKAEYKTKFCLFELKSPQMEGFIKNKHAK